MNYATKPFVIILYGATGVGKTDTALFLGEHIPIEIINMDVGQFYTPFSIGTAKPDWKQSTIPHHFFDIINEPASMTVVTYRVRTLRLIQDIISRGAIPVIVGGSSFYAYSLLFSQETFVTQQSLVEKRNSAGDWDELYSIDPERALQIKKNDTYRIQRALEIWRTTHTKPGVFTTFYSPVADFLFLHITRDRQELYKRINDRVLDMIAKGWVGEVRKLDAQGWSPFIQDKKLIGYNELLDYTKQNNYENLTQTIECIQQRTRNYAKRQETFGRKIERDIMNAKRVAIPPLNEYVGCVEKIKITHVDIKLYSEKLVQRLKKTVG
jgi:tRNA dimethylallyltransferase